MAKPKNLNELLKNDLTVGELGALPKSFDVVGDILIFSDLPSILKKKEKIIGQKILENFRNIKVVLKKIRKYSGKFRTPKLKIIDGERRKETEYKENGIKIRLNVEKVYFSPRLSNERLRICTLVKKDENILVMFSGSGVYPINLSKNSKAKYILGIEMNPIAHKYALDNLKLNKTKNVELIKGDANSIVPRLKNKFDRILMPLPKGGEGFIPLALKVSKKNTTIHFYDFLNEDEFYKSEEKIKLACEKLNKKYLIQNTVKCGQFGPRIYRVCVDFKVLS